VRGPLEVGVADLLHHPGARRHDYLEAQLRDLHVIDSRVPDGSTVTVDVVLERVSDGVVASGSTTSSWVGECRRCLREVGGELRGEFRELFERHPTEGETYPLVHDAVDLEAPVREVLMLELPLAPLCAAGCLGICPTCGVDRNEQSCECLPPERDSRWAALDALRGER
jgi:uncharacterized protein